MLRDDLKLTAYALSIGYTIRPGPYGYRFNADGVPPDSLVFSRGAVTVWWTTRGWRVAKLGENGLYPKPVDSDFHPHLKDALDAGKEM